MEPGLRAIVVLLFSALAGARLGKALSRAHPLPNGIVILSCTALVTALVFFAWAARRRRARGFRSWLSSSYPSGGARAGRQHRRRRVARRRRRLVPARPRRGALRLRRGPARRRDAMDVPRRRRARLRGRRLQLRARPAVRPAEGRRRPGLPRRRYIISVVGDGLGSAFLLYLYLGAIYWFSFAILATCVDVTPKAAPGTAAPASSAAYQKIPTGGLRV